MKSHAKKKYTPSDKRDVVPGKGNGDTVDAKMTPGEFVMPKDSTAAIGIDKLRAMKDATHTPSGQTPGYGVARMADGDVVQPQKLSLAARALAMVMPGTIRNLSNRGNTVDNAVNNQTQTQAPEQTGTEQKPFRFADGDVVPQPSWTDQIANSWNKSVANAKPGSYGIPTIGRSGSPAPLEMQPPTKNNPNGVAFAQSPTSQPLIQQSNVDAINQVAAENPGGRTAQFLGGINKPAATASTATQPAPASVTQPQANGIAQAPVVGGVNPQGDTRTTMSGSIGTTPGSPAQPVAPPPKPIIGRDGMATDAGGNPMAGYGSITVNGKQTNLSPTSVGGTAAPKIGINNPADGIDLASPEGVAALASRAMPIIMSNNAKKQADREAQINTARHQIQIIPGKTIRTGTDEFGMPVYNSESASAVTLGADGKPQFFQPPSASATAASQLPPRGAVEALRANPALAKDFDAKYGAGASAKLLGK